jgi:O-antigen ligase
MHLIVRTVISVALVFAPWAFGTTERWSLHILEGLCFLAFLLSLLERIGEGSFRMRRPVVVGLGFLTALLVVGQLLNPVQLTTIARGSVFELTGGNQDAPHTIQWPVTAEEGVRWGSFLLFGLALLHHIKSRGDIRFFLRLIVFNSMLLAVEGILQHLSGSERLLGLRLPRHGGIIFGPFVCRNNFASCVNLSLPLALGLTFLPGMLPQSSESRTPQRFLWGFGGIVILASVLLSASRAGLAISFLIIAAMVFDLMLRRRDSQQWTSHVWLIALLVGGGMMVGFVGGVQRVLEGFNQLNPEYPLRLDVWKSLWMAIQDSWWWGYGLGTFRYLFPFYQPVDITLFYEYAHNDWLEAVYDFGIAGFGLVAIFLLSVMAAILRDRVKRTSTFRRSLAGAVMISLGGCLLHAVVDFPLHIGAVQITFVAIAAIGLAGRFAVAE